MAAQGEARQYDEQVLFTLEIDGIEVAYFESCSEFEEEAGLIEQREGGSKDVVSKTDGIRTLTPITLVRAASSDTSLFDWWTEVRTNGARLAERNASIVAHNPDGSAKSRINLQRCFITKYKRGPWDATADEYVKEEITLEYHSATFLPLVQ